MQAILDLLGSIFGSEESKSKSLELIDKWGFTDEEKGDMRLRQMELYVPFALAQRVLAFGTFFLYALYFLCFLLYTMFGGETSRLTDFAEATMIQEIFLGVMLFYFNSGQFRGLVDSIYDMSKLKMRERDAKIKAAQVKANASDDASNLIN